MKTALKLPFYAIWALILAAGFVKLLFVKRYVQRWPNGQPFTEGDRWADAAVYSDDDILANPH